jgi:RHH-type proline utilization regulon transcriptional repressor/proline dehydrogenase/delta 1-pyrroline-5-carboxylate dehydrogenase
MGPGKDAAMAQVKAVTDLGGCGVPANGELLAEALTAMNGLGGVIWWGDPQSARTIEQALAQRVGPIIALITSQPQASNVLQERHVCIDTTAAGGNAALLAEVGNA